MTVARLELLLEGAGADLLRSLAGQDVTGSEVLRLGTALRKRFPAQLVIDALAQQELRHRARGKFARAGDMFFTRAGLEQASGEVVARHRSARFAGSERMVDLCCGIGGDLVSLAQDRRVVGVDLDPVHLWMARQNARVHGVADRTTLIDSDVRDVGLSGGGLSGGGLSGGGLSGGGLSGVDAAFVDPARRSVGGRKRVGDSEPPLDWCFALTARVPKLGIKAAPGLPHDAVPPGWELEFVAVDRELKEASVWSPALATTPTRATILPAGNTLVGSTGDPVPVRDPGAFLLDPNPAVTRARLVEDVARLTNCWKIDAQIAFLSTDTAVRTPFARTLRVIDSGPWNEKQLPERLRRLDIGAVDIRRRGLAGDVDSLHRRLRLSGSRRATLVMTRVRDRPWALVCVDLGPDEGIVVV